MTELFPVILFYKYVPLEDPHEFAAAQRALCSALGLKGRILLAKEGINGTLAGPNEAVKKYTAGLRSDERFADLEFKVSRGDEGTFPKLAVKVRPEIVTLNAGEIAPDHNNQLSPAAWKRMWKKMPALSYSTSAIDTNQRRANSRARLLVASNISASCPNTSSVCRL